MVQHKKQASAKTGMMPGSPIYVGENAPLPTKALIHIYDGQIYQRLEGFQPETVQEALAANHHVWVDVCGLADSAHISRLCAKFAIHPLVIEDILNTRQRPKVDIFGEEIFIVFQLLDTPEHHLTYRTEQFSMVVQENLLLTFRESDNYDLTPLYNRLSNDTSLIREHGSDYLTYLLMDSIVDNYFNFVEETGQTLEVLEDLLTKDPEKIDLQSLYVIKRRTMVLRKTIAPLRDIVHLLLSDQCGLIAEKYHFYYRDLHDHSIRLVELVDLQREMTKSILDLYLTTLNNRMNETIKVLTLFTSIFIPLTFIVGVYGMNFEYMPELKWRYSYPVIMVLMIIIVVGMLYYFKRKKLL